MRASVFRNRHTVKPSLAARFAAPRPSRSLSPPPPPPMTNDSARVLNLGGPGWFADVFGVKVFFNTDKRSLPTSAAEDDSTEVGQRVWPPPLPLHG